MKPSFSTEPPAPQGPSDRGDRLEVRKAQTRAALIGAAQSFLSAGKVNVSIQDITASADVGFGSFYNHFSNKEQLFRAAANAALDTWGELRDEAVSGLSDPAEIFALSFRMTGRLQRIYPELVRIILHSGISMLSTDHGLRPRAIEDIRSGMKTKRFRGPEPEVTIMAVGGALLGLLQLLEADPTQDDAVASDAVAEQVLLMLGVAPKEAHQIVSTPISLPPRIN